VLSLSRSSNATWSKNWVAGTISHVRLGCWEIFEDTELNTGRLAIFHVWAVSENYIVIIGASIPTLTALWRRAVGSKTYQQSYEMYGSHRASRRSFVAVEDGRPISDTQKSNHNTRQGPIRDDNTSQEHILEPAGEHSWDYGARYKVPR
jgi:hypothetical protein